MLGMLKSLFVISGWLESRWRPLRLCLVRGKGGTGPIN